MIVRNFCTTAVLAITLLVSCSKQQIAATEKGGDSLLGTWQWQRTDGGIGYHIHETPANTGKNVLLKLTAGNEFFIYTNGALTAQGTYGLRMQTCIHDQTNKTFIDFSTGQDMMVEKREGSYLELSDEAMDGVNSVFQRIEEASTKL